MGLLHIPFLILLVFLAVPLWALDSAQWNARGPHKIEKILDALRETPSGSALLTQILPSYRNGNLRIVASHSEQADPRCLESGVAGGYLNGTICLDDSLALLAAASTLFHELVHASDFLLAQEGEKRRRVYGDYQALGLELKTRFVDKLKLPTSEEKIRFLKLKERVIEITLESENHALTLENLFLNEWAALDSNFPRLLRELVADKQLLAFPLGQEQFRRVMLESPLRIPSERISSFLERSTLDHR